MAAYAHLYAREKRCGLEVFLDMPEYLQNMNIAHLEAIFEQRKREAER